jgi:hypothetical protein
MHLGTTQIVPRHTELFEYFPVSKLPNLMQIRTRNTEISINFDSVADPDPGSGAL